MTIAVVQTVKIPDTWSGAFAGNVTAGNTIFLVVTAYTNTGSAISSSAPLYNGASVTGAVKLIDVNSGGATNAVYTATWMLPDVSGAHTAVSITLSGENASPFTGSVGLTAYEVSGLGSSPSLDKSNPGNATTGTAVTSGASGAITTVPEIVIGSLIIYGQVMSDVGAPWTESQYTNQYTLAGYQVVTSGTSSYTYNQTAGGSAPWCGAIATVKGSSAVNVSLPVAQVTASAPLPALAAGPVAVPVAHVSVSAPLLPPSVRVPLPASAVTAAAPLPSLAAGPVAVPVAQVAAAANTVTGAAITAGVILNEAGGGLLAEDGGSLATEVPSGAVTLPAAAVAVAAPLPSPVVSVPLPAAQVNVAGYPPTPASGTAVALPVAQVTASAPAPSLAAGPVALPAPAVTVAAPLPTPVVSVPLPAAQESAAAYSPASAAGPVSLPAAAVTVAAPVPTPKAAVPLPVAQVNVTAPLPAPLVSVPIPVAQVNVAGHPLAPNAPVFVALPVAQVTAAALPVTPFVPPVFPAVPLDLECQLNLGGTWTDVTTYAYQREGTSPPIGITRGKPDESSQANPATATWEWNNRDGRFSPKNPLSPYYGMLGRNTPVRWSVPAESPYLRLEDGVGSYASCPEASRLDVTGSLEVRLGLRLTDWTPCDLASKFDGGAFSSWIWNTNDDGTLQFWWLDSTTLHSVTTTAPLPVGTRAIRVTLDATTGTVTHYTSDGIDGTWAQLGTAASGTGGAATTVRSGSGGSVPLTAGWSANNPTWQMLGRVTGLRLYNGIGGTVVADAAFSAQSAGATSWTDAPGNTWTVTGDAEVSDRDYRFHGEMSSQPPRWDVTGRDMSVTAAAGGPLRRLTQGTANAMSAMKRGIMQQTGNLVPPAYWSLEDAAGATVFGASLGGLPMTFDQNPAPDLATDSSFLASAPLPTLNGSRLYGRVAPYAGGNSVIVRWLCKLGTVTLLPGLTYAPLARISASGTVRALYVVAFAGSGTLGLIGYDASGTDVINTGPLSYGAAGTPLYYSAEIQLVSGNVQVSLVTLAPGASSGLAETVTLSGGVVGNCSVISLNPNAVFTDTVVGHVTLQTTDSSLFALGQPLNAWTGETAASRYGRLAGENGYQARIIGPPATSAAMGPQGVDTLGNLLNECEAADLGQQYEPRQVLSLGYRTLASMCSQAPALSLDYAQSQPGGVNGDGSDSGLDPVYDDQLSKNDWTLTRGSSTGSQGATWQAQLDDGSPMSISDPPAGIGDYADTQTVNVEYDAQLQDVAGWMVHSGTVDEARWPVIPLNLARPAMSSLYWDALDLDIGDYVQLGNVPDLVLYDPVRQLMLGTSEKLGGFHYTQEHNAVPESPYEVIVLDDPVYGRVDTDGSVLHTAVSSSATTLSVATASGFPLWTTAAADFPFDIAIAGERVTVTSITGASSPQTFTVTRAVNGVAKSQSAGSDVRLFFPPILSLA